MEKILFFMILLFLVFGSFNFSNAKSKLLLGPKIIARVAGPKHGPPSRVEINKLKYTKDPDFIGKKNKEKKGEESFFDWLIEFFNSLF